MATNEDNELVQLERCVAAFMTMNLAEAERTLGYLEHRFVRTRKAEAKSSKKPEE
jgi:hypothetical protein